MLFSLRNRKNDPFLMKKTLLLIFVALMLFSCEKETIGVDTDNVPQQHAGRTVLAFFWADTNAWLNDSLRTNIKYMMNGLQAMTDSAALVVYWDGAETDPNWPFPVIVKYETNGRGAINGYSKEVIDAMMANKSSLNDLVKIGTIEKTYPSQTSTDEDVIQTVINDMIACYSSDSYGIIFGSHGSGWLPGIFGTRSIGQDGGQYSTNTAMIPELARALQNVNPQKFDFVLLDACMMGCAEVYYELKDATRYCIASVLDVPGAGFPYKNIMSYLYADHLKDNLQLICKKYIDIYNGEAWGTVAAVDCSQMNGLAAATRSVILANQSNLKKVNTSNLQGYGKGSNFKGYAYDMVQYLETLCVGEIPAEFMEQFNKTVLYADYTPSVSDNYYKIDGDNYCGMGMYIPNSSTSGKYSLWNNYFKSIAWYKPSGWSETETIWGK